VITIYIKEVRNIIKNYSEEELRILIAEMYKAIPKKVREEKNIDRMVENINTFMNSKKLNTQRKENINVDLLEYEVEEFVDYAYKQYYFAPNSYVHKKDRSKWRFKVSKFIKKIEKVTGDTEDFNIATKLLIKLYEVLCYGCYFVIFSSNDPFRSIRKQQNEVFSIIVGRLFVEGINQEKVAKAIKVMASNKPHSSLIPEIMKYLKTPDSKKMAINQCDKIKQTLKKKGILVGTKLEKERSDEFNINERINIVVQLAFNCYFELKEFSTACEYFYNNYKKDKEVKLFILLRLIFEKGRKNLWIEQYEKYLQEGIEPRKKLIETYQYILENEELPEYM